MGEMPGLYTSKMTQLEMQENMTSFTDQIVGLEGGGGVSEIVPAHLYLLVFAKHYHYRITSSPWYWALLLPGDFFGKEKALDFFH